MKNQESLQKVVRPTVYCAARFSISTLYTAKIQMKSVKSANKSLSIYSVSALLTLKLILNRHTDIFAKYLTSRSVRVMFVGRVQFMLSNPIRRPATRIIRSCIRRCYHCGSHYGVKQHVLYTFLRIRGLKFRIL